MEYLVTLTDLPRIYSYRVCTTPALITTNRMKTAILEENPAD